MLGKCIFFVSYVCIFFYKKKTTTTTTKTTKDYTHFACWIISSTNSTHIECARKVELCVFVCEWKVLVANFAIFFRTCKELSKQGERFASVGDERQTTELLQVGQSANGKLKVWLLKGRVHVASLNWPKFASDVSEASLEAKRRKSDVRRRIIIIDAKATRCVALLRRVSAINSNKIAKNNIDFLFFHFFVAFLWFFSLRLFFHRYFLLSSVKLLHFFYLSKSKPKPQPQHNKLTSISAAFSLQLSWPSCGFPPGVPTMNCHGASIKEPLIGAVTLFMFVLKLSMSANDSLRARSAKSWPPDSRKAWL